MDIEDINVCKYFIDNKDDFKDFITTIFSEQTFKNLLFFANKNDADNVIFLCNEIYKRIPISMHGEKNIIKFLYILDK